jgi:hypothetical protein
MSQLGGDKYDYKFHARLTAVFCLVSWQEQGWTITFGPVEGGVRVLVGPKASRKEFSA